MECGSGEATTAESQSYPHPTTIVNVEIRRATLHDADLVRAITRTVYVDEGWATSPGYIEQLLDVESRIVQCTVLLADEVGTLTVVHPPHPTANIARTGEIEVRMLCVLPHARGRGVAQALMRAAEAMAVSSVVLSTSAAMTAAQRLYEGLGYVRTPQRDWEIHGERLLTYAKAVAD